MKKTMVILAAFCSLALQAGVFSGIDLAVREAAEYEFATSESALDRANLFDSVVLTNEIENVAGCDMVWQGKVIVKSELVYFDACIVINSRYDIDVALSERHIND